MERFVYEAPFMELEEIDTSDVLMESYTLDPTDVNESYEGQDLEPDDFPNKLN